SDLLDALAHVLDARAELVERLARALDGLGALGGAAGAGLDHLDGAGGLGLDLADQPGDAAGGLLRLLSQLADLLGDDGEAAALLARARRLDRGVQCQQVGLLGDRGDRRDDPTDLGRLGPELADRVGDGARRFADRVHRLGRLPDRLV